jgi:hypothetical protein
MIGQPVIYTVVNRVIEVRSTLYPQWVTWAGTGLVELADDEAALRMFLDQLRTRHDPARMQFRLVHRTAFIVDQVMAEERPDGSLLGIEEDPAAGGKPGPPVSQ